MSSSQSHITVAEGVPESELDEILRLCDQGEQQSLDVTMEELFPEIYGQGQPVEVLSPQISVVSGSPVTQSWRPMADQPTPQPHQKDWESISDQKKVVEQQQQLLQLHQSDSRLRNVQQRAPHQSHQYYVQQPEYPQYYPQLCHTSAEQTVQPLDGLARRHENHGPQRYPTSMSSVRKSREIAYQQGQRISDSSDLNIARANRQAQARQGVAGYYSSSPSPLKTARSTSTGLNTTRPQRPRLVAPPSQVPQSYMPSQQASPPQTPTSQSFKQQRSWIDPEPGTPGYERLEKWCWSICKRFKIRPNSPCRWRLHHVDDFLRLAHSYRLYLSDPRGKWRLKESMKQMENQEGNCDNSQMQSSWTHPSWVPQTMPQVMQEATPQPVPQAQNFPSADEQEQGETLNVPALGLTEYITVSEMDQSSRPVHQEIAGSSAQAAIEIGSSPHQPEEQQQFPPAQVPRPKRAPRPSTVAVQAQQERLETLKAIEADPRANLRAALCGKQMFSQEGRAIHKKFDHTGVKRNPNYVPTPPSPIRARPNPSKRSREEQEDEQSREARGNGKRRKSSASDARTRKTCRAQSRRLSANSDNADINPVNPPPTAKLYTAPTVEQAEGDIGWPKDLGARPPYSCDDLMHHKLHSTHGEFEAADLISNVDDPRAREMIEVLHFLHQHALSQGLAGDNKKWSLRGHVQELIGKSRSSDIPIDPAPTNAAGVQKNVAVPEAVANDAAFSTPRDTGKIRRRSAWGQQSKRNPAAGTTLSSIPTPSRKPSAVDDDDNEPVAPKRRKPTAQSTTPINAKPQVPPHSSSYDPPPPADRNSPHLNGANPTTTPDTSPTAAPNPSGSTPNPLLNAASNNQDLRTLFGLEKPTVESNDGAEGGAALPETTEPEHDPDLDSLFEEE